MELTLDFMAIFGIILSISLVFIGIISRQRIYNLLSIGGFVFCAFLFIDHIALVVTFIGLIIWQVYYAFWAGVK